jgi:hypothetical protein
VEKFSGLLIRSICVESIKADPTAGHHSVKFCTHTFPSQSTGFGLPTKMTIDSFGVRL